MTTSKKSLRFTEFVELLRNERAAVDRDDALSLMTKTMNAVEDSHGFAPNDFTDRMHVFSWEFGWKDLDGDPCYWDDAFSGKHRTKIFRNGRILIERRHEPKSAVLDKPGKTTVGKSASEKGAV
jgi:hypothetical protein